jgi:phosphate transport system permease protein
MMNKKLNPENITGGVLLLFSITAILILSLIVVFLFNEGLPLFQHMGIGDFLLGDKWVPANGLYGAFPFITSTLLITLGALLIAVPLGISCAVFLSEIAPRWAKELVRPAIELLAGIPSVIYGVFAFVVIVNLVRISFNLANGETLLAGSVIMAVMILPIVISISQDSIESVPRIYREGSYAMGATDWQTISRVVVPAARRGIIASIILGCGRAIGETMAVALVIGNAERLPMSLLDSGETLTTAILLEMGEAVIGSLHYSALFCLGIIPFMVVLFLSIISSRLVSKRVTRFG